jgi:hypothetical protein
VAELAIHAHGCYPVNPSTTTQGGSTGFVGSNQFGADYTVNTQSAGSGSAHNHGTTSSSGTGATGAGGTGATGASGTGATGTSSEPSTDRQKAAVGCIGTKD